MRQTYQSVSFAKSAEVVGAVIIFLFGPFVLPIRLYNNKKNKATNNAELNDFVDMATKNIFPGGAKDIDAGTKVLLLILDNKIDYNTAVHIFTRSAAFAKIANEFSRERLKQHLVGYCLQYFNETQIDSYYDFLLAIAQTKNSINVSNSKEDFYDTMFDSLLQSNPFFISEFGCIITNDKINVADENNQEGTVAGFAFLWLRNLYNINSKLYKHAISLVSDVDDENVSDEDKKFIVSGFLGNRLDAKLFADKKALNAIFIRLCAYRLLIKRNTNGLLSFYAEHDNNEDIEYFLSKANRDFAQTAKITNIDKLTIYDIDKIFVRDMLNGEDLTKQHDDIIEEPTRTKNNKVSSFITANGEPQIVTHICLPERVGREMTKEELHHFAVDVLSNLYEKAGMTIVNVNRHYDRKFPNLVIKSKNGKLYYAIIETACYPQKAEYTCDFPEMKEYAKKHNAIPTFAGVSFMNASREWDRLVCGDEYFVDFKGLETI
jgi:hypothetical protein